MKNQLMSVEGCLPLRKGFGNKANCTTFSDGHEVCLVSCRPGYAFPADKKPLSVYVCGPNTSYTWNGVPPSCGRKLLALFITF